MIELLTGHCRSTSSGLAGLRVMQLGDLSAGADSRHGEARDVGFRSIDWSRTHGASTAENATHGRVALIMLSASFSSTGIICAAGCPFVSGKAGDRGGARIRPRA